jgi:hypothetical protein
MTVREETLHVRHFRVSTTYPETDMVEGLGLWLSRHCCLIADIGRALVTSYAPPCV